MKTKAQKTASKNHTTHSRTSSTAHSAAGSSRNGVAPTRRKPGAKATPSLAYPGDTPVVLSDTVTARTPQIDKIILVLMSDDVSAGEQGAIAERLQRKLSTKDLSRGSAKQEPFKRVFIQRLPTGAVVKFATEPTRPDYVRQFMQITINPNQMQTDDVEAFGEMVKAVLGPSWERRMKAMKCCRLDVCVDVEGVLANDLIVMFQGSRTQATFFVQCDPKGHIQTIYVGSVQSAVHGCVYDQTDSDAFKSLVGEKPSLPQLKRVKAREDAELAIINYPKKGRTRFEVRNILSPMVSITDLATMESAMHRFTVYEVRKKKGVPFDTQFRMYLDSVRLRGVTGARAYLTANAKKVVMDKVQDFEDRLTKLSAVWWTPEAFVLDMCVALQQNDMWSLLNPGRIVKATPKKSEEYQRGTPRRPARTATPVVELSFNGLDPDEDE